MVKAKQIGPTSAAQSTITIGDDDPTIPKLATRPAQQRIRGDAVSDEVIAAHVKRTERATARAQTVKREKATPRAKQTHAVENDNVHTDNESARQVDALDEIDRDSEIPSSYKPPNKLDAPPPRAGFSNRWCRYRSGNDDDAEHFDSMLEEGWRPVKRQRVRRLHELTAITHQKYGQYYVKRGLILMEIPEELETQRARYFHQQQKQMNRGVDENLFKLRNRLMPLLKPQRTTRVSMVARRGRLQDMVPGDEADA